MPANYVISLKEISDQCASFTIGFGQLSVQDKMENVTGGGSGTLVRIGTIHGILTAAHVLAELPSSGPVGLVPFLGTRVGYWRPTIEIQYTDKLVFEHGGNTADGPDLAFLKLPPTTLGSIKAVHSFVNLDLHRKEFHEEAPAPDYFDALVGMVDERTSYELGSASFSRYVKFQAQFCDGKVSNERQSDGFDVLDFRPTTGSDARLPKSFEGTSGGALWRLYLVGDGETVKIAKRRLWGVPFYQSPLLQGVRVITCHGPFSLYDKLYDEVKARWPNDA